MQPDVAVEVDGLTKVFRDPVLGEHRAVDGVSFACRYGRVFGLLGPNGAGKTTTLRMVATVLSPTAGTARVAGHDVAADPDAARARIGFLTASTGVYERLTPREILAFFGRLHRMDDERLAARTGELLD
ncbi:MAG: ATP-binding cassette domain-containing protein, partial [Planctomycetes bacterium]|nr:ATP-binding cassette domain-containing protein [Planctomycetota bacterium]